MRLTFSRLRQPRVRLQPLRPLRDGFSFLPFLLPAFRHPRVAVLPLGPFRVGFFSAALFALFVVVLFLFAYLLVLLGPLALFGLPSSSPTIASSCSSSWPLCGIRRPLPRALALSS